MNDILVKITEYLECDPNLISHYENTFYLKVVEITKLREKLHDMLKMGTKKDVNPIKKPSKTLKEYNDWRNNKLKDATVEEKLEWNMIRKEILEYDKLLSGMSDVKTNVKTHDTSICNDDELSKLMIEIETLERQNHELWTQIVNYRTTLNIGNTIRGFLQNQC